MAKMMIISVGNQRLYLLFEVWLRETNPPGLPPALVSWSLPSTNPYSDHPSNFISDSTRHHGRNLSRFLMETREGEGGRKTKRAGVKAEKMWRTDHRKYVNVGPPPKRTHVVPSSGEGEYFYQRLAKAATSGEFKACGYSAVLSSAAYRGIHRGNLHTPPS
ncbi:hypothetical protein OF83DRAFT_1089492 [Amylostereum chailletii]|nr:hypothetical protein OF83DRAFT_1089492 [Amylostereum chailletii]